MFKCKQYLLIILSIIFVITLLGKPVYATTTELSINDEGSENGFVTKDEQLYYVVTISSKTTGGSLGGIRFKLRYDDAYLKMLDLEKGEVLDLGAYGKYEGKSHIMCYKNDKWSKSVEEETNYMFNDKTGIYNAGNKSDYTLIDEKEIDLVKVCFKVVDNVEKKHAVFIDTESNDTKITGGHTKSDVRYVTNGVEIPSWMIEKEDDEQEPSIGEEGSQENGQKPSTGNGGSQGNGQKPSNGGIGSDDKKEEIEKIPAKEEGKKDDAKAPGILPNTGMGKVALLTVIIIAVWGATQYIKFKKMKGIK